ncbi:MAG TPA: 50S ribosomal protein L11 methyltransferase [Gammaproteobacteria bacterium]
MSIEFHRRMLADAVRHQAFYAALERVIDPGRTTVADIGAGTGILAFLARRLGAREVWLYEPGDVLGLAEAVAARSGIDGLHFVPQHSLSVEDPVAVDVVIAEVLGNFAYEEGVLETLRDAPRFLAPGGTLIPREIAQWAAPVSAERFERDLRSWRSVGFDLDFADAERMSRNNMYVFPVEPGDLLPVPPAEWDRVRFSGSFASRRSGRVEWSAPHDGAVHGFALWWECTLVPGVVLSTSPFAPRTHWDQIYLPLLEPLALRAGDAVALEIESETGGGEAGIAVRWTAEQRRGEARLARQSLDIGAGYLAS